MTQTLLFRNRWCHHHLHLWVKSQNCKVGIHPGFRASEDLGDPCHLFPRRKLLHPFRLPDTVNGLRNLECCMAGSAEVANHRCNKLFIVVCNRAYPSEHGIYTRHTTGNPTPFAVHQLEAMLRVAGDSFDDNGCLLADFFDACSEVSHVFCIEVAPGLVWKATDLISWNTTYLADSRTT